MVRFSLFRNEVIEGTEQRVNAGLGDVRVAARAPVHLAVRRLNAHIGHSGGAGVLLLQAVLGIDFQGVVHASIVLQGVAESIQAAVAGLVQLGNDAVLAKGHIAARPTGQGLKAHIPHGNRGVDVQVAQGEHPQHIVGFQLPMLVIGDVLAEVTKMLPHPGGQHITVGVLQKIADAALAALGVDPDDIGIVSAADIPGVDGDIGHGPPVQVLLLPPVHTLGDGYQRVPKWTLIQKQGQ